MVVPDLEFCLGEPIRIYIFENLSRNSQRCVDGLRTDFQKKRGLTFARNWFSLECAPRHIFIVRSLSQG
jgi:hypothetical protein